MHARGGADRSKKAAAPQASHVSACQPVWQPDQTGRKLLATYLARRVPEEAGAGPAELPEPRGALAARLGMTPETLSRTLNALEARGAIRLSAKRADVVDRALLMRLGIA